jgi:hypothetical protein
LACTAAPWMRRTVSNVQSSDAWSYAADLPQLGPRSAVRIPPMAGELAHPRRKRDQDGAVRAAPASIRRTPHRRDLPGMPDLTLFWTAADLELTLFEFQRYTTVIAPTRGWRASAGVDPARGWRPRKSPFVSLAAALSWALSHADGGVRRVRETCGRHLRSRIVSTDENRSCPRS